MTTVTKTAIEPDPEGMSGGKGGEQRMGLD